MAYQKQDKTGVLFKNNDKQKDTHADYKGDCVIEGQDYWINVWLKKSESGRSYMSLSFKPKQAQAPAPAPRPAERPRVEPKVAFDDMDDDIPF